jgi:hypothetical protein
MEWISQKKIDLVGFSFLLLINSSMTSLFWVFDKELPMPTISAFISSFWMGGLNFEIMKWEGISVFKASTLPNSEWVNARVSYA